MKIKRIAVLIGPIVACEMTFGEFIRAGFNKAGTLIWLKDSLDSDPILIGDINPYGNGSSTGVYRDEDPPNYGVMVAIHHSKSIRAHCRLTLEII